MNKERKIKWRTWGPTMIKSFGPICVCRSHLHWQLWMLFAVADVRSLRAWCQCMRGMFPCLEEVVVVMDGGARETSRWVTSHINCVNASQPLRYCPTLTEVLKFVKSKSDERDSTVQICSDTYWYVVWAICKSFLNFLLTNGFCTLFLDYNSALEGLYHGYGSLRSEERRVGKEC